MSWFSDERQKFICSRLEKEGHIIRRDIMRQFSVSLVTASADLKRYRAAYGGMVYNALNKRYEKVVK